MSIYATVPMIINMGNTRAVQVCIKMEYRGFEISLVLDNSYGAMPKLGRSDLRVYKGNEDISDVFYEPSDVMMIGTPENIRRIMNKIDEILG